MQVRDALIALARGRLEVGTRVTVGSACGLYCRDNPHALSILVDVILLRMKREFLDRRKEGVEMWGLAIKCPKQAKGRQCHSPDDPSDFVWSDLCYLFC